MSQYGFTRFGYWAPSPDHAAVAELQGWVSRHPSYLWRRPITPRELADALLSDASVRAALEALESPLGQAVVQAALGMYLPAGDAELVDLAVRLAIGEILYRRLPWGDRVLVSLGIRPHP